MLKYFLVSIRHYIFIFQLSQNMLCNINVTSRDITSKGTVTEDGKEKRTRRPVARSYSD